MKFATDLNKGILGNPDSTELWLDIIAEIPDSVLTKPNVRILIVACGHGTEAVLLAKRMMSLGGSAGDINDAIYLIDKYRVFTNHAKLVYGFKNVVTEDFMNWIPNMNFDVIVGNPPFDDTSDDSSYTNLWSQIYKKSWSLLNKDGYLAMVTPRTWATPKQEGRESQTSEIQRLISDHATVINIDECARHFPKIGSSFTYSVLAKQPRNIDTKIITPGGVTTVSDLPEIITRLPKNINTTTLSIFRKVFTHDVFVKEKGTSLKGNMIHERDLTPNLQKKYPYRVQYSDGTVKWSDTKHRLQDLRKVMWPNQTSRNFPLYDDGISSPPNRGAVYLVQNKKEGQRLINYIKSPVLQFIIQEQRTHHGVLNTEVISNIPKVDLTKDYTNEELYKHFKLTKTEINYIESNVK
jgi:methylase of polypeptide subunit release factors